LFNSLLKDYRAWRCGVKILFIRCVGRVFQRTDDTGFSARISRGDDTGCPGTSPSLCWKPGLWRPGWLLLRRCKRVRRWLSCGDRMVS